MTRAAWLLALAAACGHHETDPSRTTGSASGTSAAPKRSPGARFMPPETELCAAARAALLGPKAECAQELLADAPGGKLYRIYDRSDAFAHRVFVIRHADGKLDSSWSAGFIDTRSRLSHSQTLLGGQPLEQVTKGLFPITVCSGVQHGQVRVPQSRDRACCRKCSRRCCGRL